MTISDETLMAFADGELDAATRAVIEAAMREDPEVFQRVARHRALRAALQGAFSEVLNEPVPERLIAAARRPVATPASNVVDLAQARGAAAREAPRNARPSWRWQPGAMAASLLMGFGLGYLAWHGSPTVLQSSSSGGLVAGRTLAEALSTQLSADRPAGTVAAVGMSFRSKSGDYCRTFSLSGTDAGAGLACREGDSWKIKVLAQAPHAAASSSNYRTAGSEEPAAIRAAVEQSIDGQPLDRAGEIAARREGWATR